MKNLNFTFVEGEVELILDGLAELPFKVSAKIIAKISTGASQQLSEPEKESKKDIFRSFRINGSLKKTTTETIKRATLIELGGLAEETDINGYTIKELSRKNEILVLGDWPVLEGAELWIEASKVKQVNT